YRDLTAALICGAIVAFTAGVWLGGRVARAGGAALVRRAAAEADVVKLAARFSIVLLALALARFLAQLISKFGIGPVLRVSGEVKGMLGDRFEVVSHFSPKADPGTAERIHLAHHAYLARRL